MPSFRLITEGITDQVVLEIILSIFYDDPDIDVERLQPPGDETDRHKQTGFGGWALVFKYLQSSEFKEAMDFADYFIIQLDTDISQEFDVPHQKEGKDLKPEEIFELVKEKLIDAMEPEFFNQHREKMLFAISIHSIECWFLPLYYNDKRKAKLLNCLDTLNKKLSSREGFSIGNPKKARDYEKLARKFRKQKELFNYSRQNPSFKIFIDSLPTNQ